MKEELRFPVTRQMQERMDAGLSFIYTTRSGHTWYIDATLNIPFRQIDLSECMYDAFDGRDIELGFPSLSMCQLALEENCPQWRGEGWYLVGNDDDVERIWFDDIGKLRDKVVEIRGRFDVYGIPWTADYLGEAGDSYER